MVATATKGPSLKGLEKQLERLTAKIAKRKDVAAGIRSDLAVLGEQLVSLKLQIKETRARKAKARSEEPE
jgi:septal ring factor EnvC (AmiA/AmiB activator)